MKIFKYLLQVTNRQRVTMPEGAVPLTIQIQNGHLCLWALVNDAAPARDYVVTTYGTGHVVAQDPGKYLGTYQLDGGALVFHVFFEG